MNHTYHETTQGIEIDVCPQFISERSNLSLGIYFYAYTVTIKNNTSKKCQLLKRNWTIRDGNGKVERVLGDGVVGQRPILSPGESFEYTSACPLNTPTGNMRGWYTMVDEDGEQTEVRIPLFFLRANIGVQ